MTLPTAISDTPELSASRTEIGAGEHGSDKQQPMADVFSQLPKDLYSDEPPLETTLHLQQMMLLINCLNWLWKDRNDYFATGNLTVYYSPTKRKDEDFRGPDFFVALDTDSHPRNSWMIWEEEGKYPNVIVELLSDSTAKTDRGLKKDLYEQTFRTPEYYWFDPNPTSLEFEGFALVRGKYEPIQATEQGWLWSEQLQLYLGIQNEQLRYFEPNGQLVPTPDEAAVTAEEEISAAEEKAAVAEEKAAAATQALTSVQEHSAKLIEKLRELGVDPDDI